MNDNGDNNCDFQLAEMMEQMRVMMNTMQNMRSTALHKTVDSGTTVAHNLESQMGQNMVSDEGNARGLFTEQSMSMSSAQPISANNQVTSTLERGMYAYGRI